MTVDGQHTNSGTTMPNIGFSLEDVGVTRHVGNFISSALDGHVEMNKSADYVAWNAKAGNYALQATAVLAGLFDGTPGNMSQGTPFEFISDQGGTVAVSGPGLLASDYSITTNGLRNTVTITKLGGPYTITKGSISKQVTVLGPPDAGTSTMVADKYSIKNDGIEAATITVTVKDSSNNPLSNVAVAITGATTNPTSGSTNTSGIFTATFTSTNIATYNLTATFGPVAAPITKTISIDVTQAVIPLIVSEPFDVGAGLYTTVGYLSGQKPCLLYTSPSPRDRTRSRMPSSA